MWVNYTALEDHNWMAISTESVSKLKNDIYTEDRQPCSITEENAISIRKRDERNSSAVEIGFHNEIVTWISRGYSGTVSGFEGEPSLW